MTTLLRFFDGAAAFTPKSFSSWATGESSLAAFWKERVTIEAQSGQIIAKEDD